MLEKAKKLVSYNSEHQFQKPTLHRNHIHSSPPPPFPPTPSKARTYQSPLRPTLTASNWCSIWSTPHRIQKKKPSKSNGARRWGGRSECMILKQVTRAKVDVRRANSSSSSSVECAARAVCMYNQGGLYCLGGIEAELADLDRSYWPLTASSCCCSPGERTLAVCAYACCMYSPRPRVVHIEEYVLRALCYLHPRSRCCCGVVFFLLVIASFVGEVGFLCARKMRKGQWGVIWIFKAGCSREILLDCHWQGKFED